MGHQLIGEVLSSMGRLSSIDIDEILAEQAISGMKFGAIAVSLGMCGREQVCEAWCLQLADEIRTLGLDAVGFDLREAACLPEQTARRWGVLPMGHFAGIAVMAAARAPTGDEVVALAAMLGRDVRFVAVGAEEMERALRGVYGVVSQRESAHAAA